MATPHRECYNTVRLLMKKSLEFPFFCQSAEMDFHYLGGPRNLNVDIKCDILCLEVCVGISKLLNYVVGGVVCRTLT